MKPHRLSSIPLAFVLLLSILFPAEAQEPLSAETIIAKANHVANNQGQDGRAQVSMAITDSQGRERQRRFTLLRRNVPSAQADGDQQFYVYFHRPADVNKTVFLVHKHVGRDDDRWLYLPALDLVKRIAASDERTSFVGSDFFYEDVSGRGVDEDQHVLAETTYNFFVIESRPKDAAAVEFASYKIWIHRRTFLPIKMNYFDKNKTVFRSYEALKVETIQGKPTVVKSRMKDERSGSETVVTYRDVQYDIGLPDEIFTERYLRNPPREYLR